MRSGARRAKIRGKTPRNLRACYAENQDAIMVKYRAKKADPRFRAQKLYHRAKDRAARNGREFTLSIDDVVIPSHCPITGKPLDIGQTGEGFSLDRIDNSKGYVPGNVWVISHRMNTLKNSATIDEIRALLHHMEQHEAAMSLVM